jgi:hypothetical protein
MGDQESRPKLIWHHRAIELAVKGAGRSATIYATAPNDIVRDALFALSRDAVVIHRAVGDLVLSGWSGAATVLLRTLIDIQISILTIVNSRNPMLAAFRYFYSTYRSFSRDHKHYTPELRREARETIRGRIASLPLNDRPTALRFLREKDRPYWFAEEFRTPSAVIDRFATADVLDLYRQLSSAAHGGFLGLRLFSDNPSDLGVNPQLPIGDKAAFVALASARLLVEITSLRNHAEGLGLDEQCQRFREALHKGAMPPVPQQHCKAAGGSKR